MSKSTRRGTGASAVVGALVLAVVFGAPAMAHTDLADSSPADGETVVSLDTVRLEFTGDLLDIGAELTLVGPTGESTSLDVEFPEPQVVEAAVPALLAGEQTLRWRVVSEDGHPIEGEIPFTADPPAPSRSPSPTPITTSSPEPASSPTPSALPLVPEGDLGVTAGESISATEAVLIALAGAALVTVAWLISRVLRSRRERN